MYMDQIKYMLYANCPPPPQPLGGQVDNNIKIIYEQIKTYDF